MSVSPGADEDLSIPGPPHAMEAYPGLGGGALRLRVETRAGASAPQPPGPGEDLVRSETRHAGGAEPRDLFHVEHADPCFTRGSSAPKAGLKTGGGWGGLRNPLGDVAVRRGWAGWRGAGEGRRRSTGNPPPARPSGSTPHPRRLKPGALSGWGRSWKKNPCRVPRGTPTERTPGRGPLPREGSHRLGQMWLLLFHVERALGMRTPGRPLAGRGGTSCRVPRGTPKQPGASLQNAGGGQFSALAVFHVERSGPFPGRGLNGEKEGSSHAPCSTWNVLAPR